MQRHLTIIAALAAALLLGLSSVQAAPETAGIAPAEARSCYDYSDMPDTESAAMMKNSINAALEPHRERMRQAPKEVADGLYNTVEAVHALRDGDVMTARKHLEAATKLFRIALANNPHLAQVPVRDSLAFDELEMTTAEISQTLKQAATALEEHRTQAARALMMPLTDALTITTEVLPMGQYPDTTAQALTQLKQGQKALAMATLQGAFATIVTEEEVLPLPLLKAQAFSDAASRTGKAKRDETLKFITSAQDELEKAVLLGYTSPEDIDYKRISDQLAQIRKFVEDGGKTENAFERLMDSFKAMLKKAENGVHKTAAYTPRR